MTISISSHCFTLYVGKSSFSIPEDPFLMEHEIFLPWYLISVSNNIAKANFTVLFHK